MKLYCENYIVDFRDVDRFFDFKLPQLLQVFSTVSTKHTNDLGFDPFYLTRQGLSWILYEWKIDIFVSKLYAQSVKIETFAVDKKNTYFIRYFAMYDKNDILLARAYAKWVVIDVNERKIVKLPSEIIKVAKIDLSCLNDKQKYMIAIDEKPLRLEKRCDEAIIRKYPIRFYDIDSNYHTNNVVYVDWAIESLNFDDNNCNFLKEYKPSSLSVVYKKESGDSGYVICKTYLDNMRSYHEIYSQDNILLTILEINWVKRN